MKQTFFILMSALILASCSKKHSDGGGSSQSSSSGQTSSAQASNLQIQVEDYSTILPEVDQSIVLDTEAEIIKSIEESELQVGESVIYNDLNVFSYQTMTTEAGDSKVEFYCLGNLKGFKRTVTEVNENGEILSSLEEVPGLEKSIGESRFNKYLSLGEGVKLTNTDELCSELTTVFLTSSYPIKEKLTTEIKSDIFGDHCASNLVDKSIFDCEAKIVSIKDSEYEGKKSIRIVTQKVLTAKEDFESTSNDVYKTGDRRMDVSYVEINKGPSLLGKILYKKSEVYWSDNQAPFEKVDEEVQVNVIEN